MTRSERLLESLFPPMLATLKKELPPGKWILELKYDGYRAVAAWVGRELAMWTRNRLDLTSRFPGVAAALQTLAAKQVVVDGEIVALDRKGRPQFSQMGEGHEEFFAFDLLYLDGHDLRGVPIESRRLLLEQLLADPPPLVHLAERVVGKSDVMLRKAIDRGFEGLVAKQAGSAYEGRRSTAWIKLKAARRQEMVIVGYAPRSDGADRVGALLLAVADGSHFRFAGKVGTGFSEKTQAALWKALTRLAHGKPDDVVDAPRISGATWVRPLLVAEVSFAEWTADGRLRHPVFVGLRPDKAPSDCVREPG